MSLCHKKLGGLNFAIFWAKILKSTTMKTLKVVLLSLLITLGLTACSQKQDQAAAQDQTIKPVDTLMMSQDSVDAYLAQIMNGYVLAIRHQLLTDTTVLKTIAQTQAVIQDIEQNNIDKAKNDLHTLIGKLDVYLTKNPDAALVPIDVSYRKIETINNIDSVRALAKTVKKAVNDGYYQVAKQLLQVMTSEMVISTAYIPVVAYLEGLKYAATLLDEGKTDEAMILMQQTLSTVAVTTISIPLPVLKAQIYIDQAAKLYAQNHENIKQIINLLDNADYQLKLAEEMGYGKRDKEFKTLYKAIKELKRSVKAKEESTQKFENLRKELKSFKERLFPVNAKKAQKQN